MGKDLIIGKDFFYFFPKEIKIGKRKTMKIDACFVDENLKEVENAVFIDKGNEKVVYIKLKDKNNKGLIIPTQDAIKIYDNFIKKKDWEPLLRFTYQLCEAYRRSAEETYC